MAESCRIAQPLSLLMQLGIAIDSLSAHVLAQKMLVEQLEVARSDNKGGQPAEECGLQKCNGNAPNQLVRCMCLPELASLPPISFCMSKSVLKCCAKIGHS